MTALERRRRYLAALAHTFKAPEDTAMLRELLPDWPGAAQGVRFTMRSARNRRAHFARALFPRLFARALDANQRARLESALLSEFAGAAPDWSANGHRVVEVIAALVSVGELPAAAYDAAQHEWALVEADRRPYAPAEWRSGALYMVNPTLEARVYESDVAAWVSLDVDGLPARTKSAPVLPAIAYFRHPTTRRARWRTLDPFVLALLGVVEEAVDPDDAARSSGGSAQHIREALEVLVNEGVLLRNGA